MMPDNDFRDFVATFALVGLLSRHAGELHGEGTGSIDPTFPITADDDRGIIAFRAYQLADAMIDVRSKTSADDESAENKVQL